MESVSEGADVATDLKRSRRRSAGFSDVAPVVDRLPPHSPEAEQGVLGCILLAPAACLEVCLKRIRSASVFYDLRHEAIYAAMLDMFSENVPIDMITLQQRLKNKQRLDEVGGLAYLTALPDTVPSAANLEYYLDIVLEKHVLRRNIQTCQEVINRIYDFSGETGLLLDIVERDLGQLTNERQKCLGGDKSIEQLMSWQGLLEFDTDNDPNCVLGFHAGKSTRYLCKGHGAWLIGPSGVGKSSLAFMMGIKFAAGDAFFGIAPKGPLRVLVVQAENDEGDMAEMAQGIESGAGLDAFTDEAKAGLVATNFISISVTGKIGKAFCDWLHGKILLHKADLVLVDPLLSFAGIDVGRQDKVSEFCRLWLDPVLRATGAVMISTHHTGKPKVAHPKAKPATIYDMMYEGLGSSELVNWARAVMLLQPAGDEAFRLVLAKRGKRAWATQLNGDWTQMLWLKHALTGIYWQQVDPPQEPEEQPEGERKGGRKSIVDEVAAMNLYGFCAGCIPLQGEGLNVISKRLEAWLAKENKDVKYRTCQRIIPALVASGKLTKTEHSTYLKGPNA